MSNQIVKALEHAAQKIGTTLAKDAGKAVKDLYHSAGQNLKKVASNVREVEEKHVADLKKILEGGEKGVPHPRVPGGGGRGRGERPLARGGKRGQAAHGNIGCHTAGDPVDVVSGQMITNEIDVELAGLLPLVLRRAYASAYIGGRLYGPGWSSTLDQRIEIDAEGVHFAGDDAQILHYPLPDGSGKRVYPVAGARWPLTWDQATGVMRIEDPDRGWTRAFAGSGVGAFRIGEVRPITELTDRNGHRIAFVRDDSGLPLEVRHSGGYQVAVDTAPTSDGTRITGLRLLEAARGDQGTPIVGYEYYPDGRLASIVNSSGLPYVYEYDDANRITAWIDRLGHAYEYEYDDDGRVTRGTGQDGFLSATFHYDTARRVTTATDSLGHATEFHYDEQHQVVKTVDPLGYATHNEYDEQGRLTARTDELDRTTRFELDEHGDPIRITAPDGSLTELAYTPLGQIASVTQGTTVTAAFTYDANGNLLTTTDAAGAQTVRTYDGQGRLTSATDQIGHTRTFETNPAGLITAVTDALGQTARITYDAFGRVHTFTDPLGTTTTLLRRVEGEITERIHPDGTRERWTYDAEGNATEQVDQAGAVTRFRIGPFGQLASQINPDGEEQHFDYDTELQLLAVTLNSNTWRYHYDEAGHLIGESDFNGRSVHYRFDGADQLLEITDTAGRTTSFAYDVLGELIERRNHDGQTTTLSYDERGLMTRAATTGSVLDYTHDPLGRVLTETVDGHTTSYTYDALGRRTSRTTPTGITSTWTYDANNQPTQLTGPLGALSFQYDAAGRETTRYLGPNAALTQTWDTCNRLSAQSIWARDTTPSAANPYTNLQERTYAYRADGMPSAIADRIRGRRDFKLTPAGRITNVTAEAWSESYTYDALGNITRAHDTRLPDDHTAGERTHTGSLLRSAGRSSYEYDDQGRLTRMMVRTLSGQRREWHYTWNGEDQLVQVDTPDRGSWAYTYDPLGRRIAKRRLTGPHTAVGPASAEEVRFTWDGTQLTEQTSTLADGSRHTVTWDWEPGTWKPVSQSEMFQRPQPVQDQASVDRRFFAIVTDLVEAPSELVTTDGRIVWTAAEDLWGRRLTAESGGAPSCPLGRPGQYHDDESGLEYNFFRYYDPATARYLSTDPLGLDAGPNPHAYVPNPLFWIDPFGLAKQPKGHGGWYGKLQPANWTDGTDNTAYEINHVPAKDCYLSLGLPTDLKESTGPAIRMEYDDHRKFISTGSSAAGKAWRAKQRRLIRRGKFDEAMAMDIKEIRRVHGTKYDAAIKEMVDSLPKNRKFQKYLKDNGWKIRTCLLK